MSLRFYEKFLSLAFGFIFLLILVMASGELLIYYLSTWSIFFYYIFLANLFLASIYGIKYYLDYQNFRKELGFYLPVEEKEEKLEYSNEDLPVVSLQACRDYRNGASYNEIKDSYGLDHPNKARRLVLTGIGVLLKEHYEMKVNQNEQKLQ